MYKLNKKRKEEKNSHSQIKYQISNFNRKGIKQRSIFNQCIINAKRKRKRKNKNSNFSFKNFQKKKHKNHYSFKFKTKTN